MATLLLARFPAVLRSGDLRPVDEAMGSRPITVRYGEYRFRIDCPHCDLEIRDGSFAFGAIRELFIRDCYFRHQRPGAFHAARTVLDLGANRGLFSVLMATHADRVIGVECQGEFAGVYAHNMRLNGFRGWAFENAFVGEGGMFESTVVPRAGIEEILRRHGLASVDLVKIDVEGSEFALFQAPGWLEATSYVSMEVHPQHGDAREIRRALDRSGFESVVADENLVRTDDPARAAFLYAWHRVRASVPPSADPDAPAPRPL